eukprot:6990663-Pyramimonas_sp.AAC.1
MHGGNHARRAVWDTRDLPLRCKQYGSSGYHGCGATNTGHVAGCPVDIPPGAHASRAAVSSPPLLEDPQ